MKKIKINKSFVASCLVCLLPVVFGLIFYDKLPEQIATHFGPENVPDGYNSKNFAIFFLPVIMLFLNMLVWFSINNDPKKKGINNEFKYILQWFVPVLSVITQGVTITYALNNKINLVNILPSFVGILIIVIGFYLPRCKQNYSVGIKLPWTLNDEENWNKTHIFASKLWIVGGILMVINTFLNLGMWLIISILILIAAIPAIYSYLLYKKGK